METNVNEDEKVEPSDFEKAKNHWDKHKKKYIVGGVLALSFGLGFHFGNRGNSRHHYSRLLKDGVRDAVKEGMKDVVDAGMHDVVKDGMKTVVTDVVNDSVRKLERTTLSNVRTTVSDTVKTAIKESAVTIIREVQAVEPKPLKNKHVDEVQKVIDYLTDDGGLKIRYDTDGNIYTVKSSI